MKITFNIDTFQTYITPRIKATQNMQFFATDVLGIREELINHMRTCMTRTYDPRTIDFTSDLIAKLICENTHLASSIKKIMATNEILALCTYDKITGAVHYNGELITPSKSKNGIFSFKINNTFYNATTFIFRILNERIEGKKVYKRDSKYDLTYKNMMLLTPAEYCRYRAANKTKPSKISDPELVSIMDILKNNPIAINHV